MDTRTWPYPAKLVAFLLLVGCAALVAIDLPRVFG
jgi:hypothetical protein